MHAGVLPVASPPTQVPTRHGADRPLLRQPCQLKALQLRRDIPLALLIKGAWGWAPPGNAAQPARPELEPRRWRQQVAPLAAGQAEEGACCTPASPGCSDDL